MIKKSTKNFWKMQGEGAWGIQRVLNMIHGYMYYTLYDHYVTAALFVVRILGKFPKFVYKTVAIDFFAKRYHCKVLTYENAKKLVTVDEEVIMPTETSKKIIPWELANKLIFNHKEHLAIVDCPCRLDKKVTGKEYCEPIHTCVFLGKTGVDFVTSHMPRNHPERATQQQVLSLLEEQQQLGRIFTLWFKDGTGYRGGVLCSCCSCCCGGVEVELLSRSKGIEGLKITAPSGFSAKVDMEKCDACGTCVYKCPYDALRLIKVNEKTMLEQITDHCMGCGVCEGVCPNGAISLKVDPGKGKIFDVDEMVKQMATHSNG
ncbi:MAG: 4Fe-4S binding protein [Desulfobacteraceae bacterium]|nr:4Fe-4S binding protein [Desulfobacteraceae bacterium]MBC2758204.1 4Fe-4S binding protein [Desulfobacteraceae bacterium]